MKAHRIVSVICLATLGWTGSLLAADHQSHPDFSGHWELVKEKSDFGKMEKPVGMTLVSEKRDGYLHSVQTTQTPQGDQSSEGDWYLDGKSHKYDKPAPGSSTTRWEGNTLVNERKSDDGQYREVTRLSMQSNGQEAVETVQTHNPNGDNRLKLVWRRAKANPGS
jgi:hypothetical protein